MPRPPTLRRVAQLLTTALGRTLAFVGLFALINGVVEARWVFVGLVTSLLIGLAPKRLDASRSAATAQPTDGGMV